MDRRSFLKSSGLVVGVALTPALLAACGGDATVAKSLTGLAGQLTGELLLPDSPAFADENRGGNSAFVDVRPMAIAMCASPSDVVACVNWCRDEGVQPGIRGGGHSYIGASSTTGLLIKTTEMNTVEVDAQAGKVKVAAGALNRNLLDTLRGGDWMLPIGTCPGVGVTGLTLGGGIGDNSRWAGMTADHLRSTRIVLASGETVTASATENSDLFWALRGGAGGNFGINTELEFDLVRLPRKNVTVFDFRFFGAEDAGAAWAAFDKLMLKAPVELSGFSGVTNQRPLGSESKFAIGRTKPFPTLSIDGCYLGPEANARELLDPLFKIAGAGGHVMGEFDFWTAQIDWLAVPDQPVHGLSEVSRFTNKVLPESAIADMISRVVSAPGGEQDPNAEFRLMCWSGGKVINGVSPTATAYVHRDSNSLLRPAIWWRPSPPSFVNELQAWLSEQWQFIQSFTQAQSFQNWPWEGVTDWQTAYYGQNFERLREVKRKYDPDNLFTYSQSIPV